MRARRALALLLCLGLLALALAGCGNGGGSTATDDVKLSVVATIFPVWDWTRNVLGDDPAGPELRLLLSDGVDMHSFQPGVEDLVTISSCDLLIYVGGESDQWIEDALAESVNPNQRALSLLEVLGDSALAEELREGMQGEADGAPDEHIWLSPRFAETLTGAIAEALSALDPARSEVYRANAETYQAELVPLAERCAAIAGSPGGCLLVADRFPFRYLTEDCGLDYYAAFSGCSAETGASFETVTFLAERLEALGLRAVCVTESPVPGVAEAVLRAAGDARAEIVTLDSLQSVTREQIAAGTTYAAVMEGNLDVIERIVWR